MNNLISLSFWFNSRPEPVTIVGQKVLAIIAIVSLVLYIVVILRAYSHKLAIYKSSIDKLLPFFITNIIITVYIVFVNYELIPVLRARLWYIIWFIVVAFWLFLIVKDFFRKTKRRESLSKEAELKKYLP
ncbi:MAG: hypothetical protein NTY12_04945 [Candidatus Falkowbacteria bacterium]|nr:hypothetical protein [Candidatus Falkowbacteria bacterium]